MQRALRDLHGNLDANLRNALRTIRDFEVIKRARCQTQAEKAVIVDEDLHFFLGSCPV